MNRESRIIDILKHELNPSQFMINNQSALHKHHAGDDGSDQTHFDIFMVSETFSGLSRVERHRMVSNLLKPEFDTGLHALSLTLKDPSEVE